MGINGLMITEANEEEEDNDAYEEPLDEDGNPYFDPATPNNYSRMMQVYNEKHKGMIDY